MLASYYIVLEYRVKIAWYVASKQSVNREEYMQNEVNSVIEVCYGVDSEAENEAGD